MCSGSGLPAPRRTGRGSTAPLSKMEKVKGRCTWWELFSGPKRARQCRGVEEEGAQGKQELPSDPLRPLLSPHPDGRKDVLRLLGQPLDRKEHGLRDSP